MRWLPLALLLAAGVQLFRAPRPSVSQVVLTANGDDHQDVIIGAGRSCRITTIGYDVKTATLGGAGSVTVQATVDGVQKCTLSVPCSSVVGYEVEGACDGALTASERVRFDVAGTCAIGSRFDGDIAAEIECTR